MPKWEEWYALAKEYYLEHSNLLVPATYTAPTGEKLGQWISTQRRYYTGHAKRGSITPAQIAALEQIGMVWEPLLIQWESAYNDAKKFYLEHGSLLVPSDYRGDSGIKLNSWLQNQKGKYFGYGDGSLTQEQISRLEEIGMMWDYYNSNWDEMFNAAKTYYRQFGDLYIPERYIAPDGKKVGAWLERQRRKRETGKLSVDQIAKLDSLGMCWDPYQEQFNRAYAEAKLYYETVGDLEIPASFETESGFKIGLWVQNLRSDYKKGKLSDDVISKLESIGMQWTATDNAIQTSYAEQVLYFYLKKYFPDAINRHSILGVELDIYIPRLNVGVEYDGVYWHKDKYDKDNRKNLFCKDNGIQLFRLREHGCPKLNGKSVDIFLGNRGINDLIMACQELLNNIFSAYNLLPIPQINYYDDISEIRKQYRHALNDTWDEQFKEAKEYYLKNGNLRVPFNYVTDTGFHLGSWITNARSNYAGYTETGISQTRIDQLNSIGMIWSVPEAQWEEGFSEAEKYYKENGNLRIPVKYISDTGYKVGVWIASQRKKDQLTPEQINRLNQIGMIWNVYAEKWDEGFQKAEKFYNQEGHLRVPHGYNYEGFLLGNWIGLQRARYLKKGGKPLTQDQIDALNAIGMIWDVFEVTWEEGYAHAQKYYLTHGNLLVPQRYICDDGYPLGSWIASRRGGYMGYGSWSRPTDAQIERLEAIGMVWDVEEYLWMQNYQLAKEYFEIHGNLQIPKRYVTECGKHLGLWIQHQRRMYLGKQSDKNLSSERIAMLNNIGMIW